MNRPEKITTQTIRLTKHLPTFWRVTFDFPPVNIFGPQQIPELNDIVTAIENDEQVKVVVFDSAADGYFITHHFSLCGQCLMTLPLSGHRFHSTFGRSGSYQCMSGRPIIVCLHHVYIAIGNDA